jgi:uncharacterized protein (DUF305 family)
MHMTPLLRLCTAGLLLGLAFTGGALDALPQSQTAGTGSHHHHAPAPAADGATGFVAEMDRGMAAMMQAMHQPGYSGNPDADFLAMMIPHHQGAIDMARLVLLYGDDPLTRRLAEEIIASQQAEIEAMRARLEILRRGPDPQPGGFPALGGTRGR